MLHAKNKCRNGLRLPWSKEINEVMTKFNILKIHLSSLCNEIDCSKQIEKKERLLAKKIILPLTITETTIALKQSRREVRICWKEFRSRQTTLLEDQEEAFIANHPNMDPAKATKTFNNAKIASNIFSKLPKKKHKGGDLTTIDVPVPRTGLTLEYQTITEPKLVEQIILRRNKLHFRQAEFNPLASPETIERLGFGATSPLSDAIINGTADVPSVTDNPMSKALLKILKTSKDKLKIQITKEKMMNK